MGWCCPFGRTSRASAVGERDRRRGAVTRAAPWEGMHHPMQQDILDFTLVIIEEMNPMIESIERKDRNLGMQVRKATSSFGMNLSEGVGVRRGSRRSRLETALGSAYEARQGLRIAVAWRYLTAAQAAAMIAALDRLAGRLYGLLRK